MTETRKQPDTETAAVHHEEKSWSEARGQLVLEPERRHLQALADHLRKHEGVVVRIFDADGTLVLDSAPPGERCTADVETCRRVLEGGPAADKQDGAVTVMPIRRSSVCFGSIVACGAEGSDKDLSQRSTGAVLDAMLDILAEESSKEHEIDSLASELALRYEEIELLYEIDEKIPLRSYPANVVQYVAEKVFDAIDCSCLAWISCDDGGRGQRGDCHIFWNPSGSDGHAPQAGGGEPLPPSTMLRLEAEQLARAVAERSMKTGEPLTIGNLENDPELGSFATELHALICLPLKVQKDFYGCLVAFKARNSEFTSYELKLMGTLARKGAFVIRDSHLYEDLDSLFFNLIKLLVNTIENKDEYTKGHSQRVRAFTMRLATLMGLPKAELDILNVSGLLHDIGKQGIPDAILKKEGKLTEEERAMINTHPIRGVNLIKHIKQFATCLPHIRHHHERIDGKGYPDGLKGDDIPLGARVIAVADTYDALTSDRCYRPRFTKEKALTIVREVAGTQLDADVANLLLDNHEDFAETTQGAQPDVSKHLVSSMA